MCVSALAWHAHPRWQLMAIGNRDEYHQRPAAALARWDDGSGIIAGRDLVGGGTWLGVNESGRFTLVTNRRGFGDPDPARRSRGELVCALLTDDSASAPLEAYNPFNLFAATADRLEYLTNRPAALRTPLAHGIYGLSNGALDEPWPKTLGLKAALSDWLGSGEADPAPLFAILASQDRPALGLVPLEPSDIPIEPRDTPPFICSDRYGTRCSTVVTIDHAGTGRIAERRFDAAGGVTGDTALDFRWPAA